MGRLVLVALAIAVPAGTAWSQPAPSPSPWHVNVEPQAAQAPDLSLAETSQLYSGDPDSRVVAGTEVLPNGMFGVGMFGEKTAETAHSLLVRPADARGRSVKEGAEVRVYAAGSRTLLGSSLVDTGSGYNAQNDLPVHFGVGEHARVDVEVIFPQSGQRTVTAAKNVSPKDLKAKPLTVRIK